ncbi:MAG: DUF5666 domain-containing protein [Pseudomonadales bacterium]
MKRFRLWVAALLSALVFVACGDGGSTLSGSGGSGTGSGVVGGGGSGGSSGGFPFGYDTGIGGSGGIVGPIQAFGSIIVNDRTLHIDGAEFEIEGEPAGTGAVGQGRLKAGQQIIAVADFDSSEASEVFYRSDIKGPLLNPPTIADLLAGDAELDVLGQRVLTNAATRYVGVALDTLSVGDLLEVSGTRDATGTLVATFIELKSTLAEYKIVGAVSALDSASSRFAIGGLSVDYSAATLADLAAPADGLIVEVRLAAMPLPLPDPAAATRIELLPRLEIGQGAHLEYEGYISGFVSAQQFVVGELAVTTTVDTQFVNGTPASLANNVKVEIEGSVDADDVLVASRIILKPTEAVRAESTLSAIDADAQTLTTAVGLTFQVRMRTEFEDESGGTEGPLDFSALQIGDYVAIKGYLDGQTLVAAEVERDDPLARQRLRAPVTAMDPASGTLALLDVPVTGDGGTITSYLDVADQPISQGEFFDLVEVGTFVEARWDPFVATSEVATQLSIERSR